MGGMPLKEHRIYVHIGKPIRLWGLSITEIGCFSAGLFGVIACEALVWKSLFLLTSLLAAALFRRFKKTSGYLSLYPFLYWHVGLHAPLPPFVPRSDKREWLG